MTNKNYPDDRLPEDENLGTAGTPRSSGREFHTHSSSFESQTHESPPSACEICGCSIPPTDSRCKDHRLHNTSKKRDSGHNWKYSHVAIAIIPANSKLHALALASAAFKRRQNAPGDGRSFELIETMDEPSDTITSDWGGDLPEAVALNSPTGTSLIQTAISTLQSNTNSTTASSIEIDFSQFENKHTPDNIFLEDGTPTQPTVVKDMTIQNPKDDEKELWIVPALLFRRDYNTKNNPIRFRDCINCGTPRKHVFDGVEQLADYREQTGRWICLTCNTATHGSLPSSKTTQEATPIPGPTKEELDNQYHKSMMSNLEKKGELE